ncbi:MAG: TlpA disulfide reductase family protein [Candidatus Poribacteria bacterium]|nr:TlpA disulfide reductase family protein [Candidatus Poribacteria bacterium]MDE0505533.1 TlpA disulfide reductase family protein [Candidatus Poribacteria bacterium]
MAHSNRFDKKWVSMPILILLLTSVISCAALEEAQQRRQERIKRKLAGYTTPPEMPVEDFSLRGQPAPLFTLQDLNGNQVSLAELRGKRVVINFWATWCGPCRMEIPHLENLSKKYKDRGLVVLGVNNESDHQAVRDFAKAQISYTVLLDGHLPFLDYNVGGIPCTYYIDKDGIIRDRDVGFNSEGAMERKINNLFSSSSRAQFEAYPTVAYPISRPVIAAGCCK